MKPFFGAAAVALLFLGRVDPAWADPRAVEIGPHNTHLLPGGKEADGIMGDFVLSNDRVEAVISGNLPLRRANMSTFYGENGITPGCLYDLTPKGMNNDQITIFAPVSQQGRVSYVRVLKDGSDGEAVVETVTTAASHNGLLKQHRYHLKDGWPGVLIVTTMRNEGDVAKSGTSDDRWTNFSSRGKVRDLNWADAVDPADRAGYAFGWWEKDGFKKPPAQIKLEPGQEITFARFLSVGRSPAEAAGAIFEQTGATGRIHGRVVDGEGNPVATAKINVDLGGETIPAYPDENGAFALAWPAGSTGLSVSDLGRSDVKVSVDVEEGKSAEVQVVMSPVSILAFNITGENGQELPCKVQFIGVDGTSSPNLGPNNRAHGCLDQYHSEKGRFEVQIPPGKYRVVVTRGIEHSHIERAVDLAAGQRISLEGRLKRVVDTTGWVSADFHNHSTPSGDNTCGTDDRVINLAAEHIEFAPTTEHNRLYDWQPHIDRLGLKKEIATITGMELTGSGAHFNTFPLKPVAYRQDNGAPVWNVDPRITALTLQRFQGENPERWLQVNHPDMVENFIDRNGDGRVDGGYVGLGRMIDAVEVLNGSTAAILEGAPFYIGRNRGQETVYYRGEFIWLQMLNRGARYWCVAVSDAHAVHGNGVGGWRMYLPSSTDAPGDIDWREMSRHAKAGKIVVSTGPFLEVTAGPGVIAGGEVRAVGPLPLRIKVQCTDWIDIDRVQVLVNGAPRADLNFTRKSHADWFQDGVVKFDRQLQVELSEDSHVIVVACGETSDLSVGYGSSTQAAWRPCAYNNPIFVDVDGGGFTPSGDTLGWPLPVKGMRVDEVKRLLARPVQP